MHHRFLAALLILSAGCASSGRVSSAVASVEKPTALLSVVDMRGQLHDLEALQASGKSVALIFWQTWCSSCRNEAPEITAAAREHGDSIEFLGVVPGPKDTVDDAEVLRVAAEWGLSYPQVRDEDLALTRRFGVRGTPTIVVLGPSGNVAYHGHRPPADWSALR